MTPPPPIENELVPPPSNRRWLYVGIGLILLIAVAILGMAKLSQLLKEPQYKSIEEIDPEKIKSMLVLALNRPDESPDISAGGKEPFVVPETDFATILEPLRNAKRVETDRGIYLGYVKLGFLDGRKLEILLHRVGDGKDPSKPPILRFSIDQYQYEVSTLDAFLKPLAEVEARTRSRR